MKTVDMKDTRKPEVWNNTFMVRKFRKGRDRIIDKQFVIVEVDKNADKKKAILEALNKLSEV